MPKSAPREPYRAEAAGNPSDWTLHLLNEAGDTVAEEFFFPVVSDIFGDLSTATVVFKDMPEATVFSAFVYYRDTRVATIPLQQGATHVKAGETFTMDIEI